MKVGNALQARLKLNSEWRGLEMHKCLLKHVTNDVEAPVESVLCYSARLDMLNDVKFISLWDVDLFFSAFLEVFG